MNANELYTPALLDHVSNPDYNHELCNATHSHQGVNPTCGDELNLHLVIKDGVIEDAAWTGMGCAISKGSADMMSDLIVGETVERASYLAKLFHRLVIGDTLNTEEREELDEAISLESISKMPARVKCAELAWRTLEEMLKSQF